MYHACKALPSLPLKAFQKYANRSLLLLPLLIALTTSRNLAAAPSSYRLAVPVISPPPSIKGVLDDSWRLAAEAQLQYDFTYRRAAEEPTTVYVAQSRGAIDIAFIAAQRSPVTARQVTNGSGIFADDYVGVYLYPQGASGFSYGFYANTRGATYQVSSENSAYTPQWRASATMTRSGFVVTMEIPLGAIRSGGSTSWKAQFVRYNVSSSSLDVWRFAPQATSAGDPVFIGTLDQIGLANASKSTSKAQQVKPRLQIYALKEFTTPAYGSNTARVGIDGSFPVTPTASFVLTLHPDYSNVEVDQQTIAPSAFPRQYADVRPFFTQTGSFFNQRAWCNNCPTTLYTPSIPTFSQGYAIEGTQGPFSFAGYDAIGNERSDLGQTINYLSANAQHTATINLQSVGVNLPGVRDTALTLDASYLDQASHMFIYTNNGIDRGTLITEPSAANYFEDGVGYSDATTSVIGSYLRIGQQFDPLDGYVGQPNIMGYELFDQKTIKFLPTSAIHDIVASTYYGRYWNQQGQGAQFDGNVDVTVDLKNYLSVELFTITQGVLTNQNGLLPFNSNGIFLGYRTATSTPTSIQYSGGSYFHGILDAWNYSETAPIAKSLSLGLQIAEDKYFTKYPGESSSTQWLERASLDWQISKEAEIDIGARRIIGVNLPNAFQPLTYGGTPCLYDPYAPGCYLNVSNMAVAFHFLSRNNEFYATYGNPNSLSTTPALYLKWIRYIGAQKGT